MSINQSAIALTASYDRRLVILLILIALRVTYTALNLAGRVTATVEINQRLWLSGGAIALGLGIWSLHVVAMLAYQLPISIADGISTVFTSVMAAVLASGLVLFVISGPQFDWLNSCTHSRF